MRHPRFTLSPTLSLRGRGGSVLVLLIAVLLVGCGQAAEKPVRRPVMDIASLLGGQDAEGLARAEQLREFTFPRDHGPHPEFRTEWWYFTGNLWDEEGGRYGFQLTFFRLALSSQAPERDSAWATNQTYMAHFAITDAAEQRFHSLERFSRGALGLAGAESDPFKVWLERWQASGASGDEPAEDGFPWKLTAEESDMALSLTIEPLKGIVLQGDRGLSRKGPGSGNASYYYSITRLDAGGILTLNGEQRRVRGTAWFDHEWSTSALGEALAGWDWFALQLGDGTDLMYYRLRQTDGGTDSHSEGTMVDSAGNAVRLTPEDISLEVLDTWRSPETGAAYPIQWRVRVEPLDRAFIIRAVIEDQEQDLNVRYWEGAVDVLEEREKEPLGWGYMELTGYTHP